MLHNDEYAIILTALAAMFYAVTLFNAIYDPANWPLSMLIACGFTAVSAVLLAGFVE